MKNKKPARHMLLTCNFCALMMKRALSWVQGQFRPCGKIVYHENENNWEVVHSGSENKAQLYRIVLLTLRNLSGTRLEASTLLFSIHSLEIAIQIHLGKEQSAILQTVNSNNLLARYDHWWISGPIHGESWLLHIRLHGAFYADCFFFCFKERKRMKLDM